MPGQMVVFFGVIFRGSSLLHVLSGKVVYFGGIASLYDSFCYVSQGVWNHSIDSLPSHRMIDHIYYHHESVFPRPKQASIGNSTRWDDLHQNLTLSSQTAGRFSRHTERNTFYWVRKKFTLSDRVEYRGDEMITQALEPILHTSHNPL